MTVAIKAATGQAQTYDLRLASLTSSAILAGPFDFVEDGNTGDYFATPTGAAEGRYRALIYKNDTLLTTGQEVYSWSGTAEDGHLNASAREAAEAFLALLTTGNSSFSAGALVNAPSGGGGTGGGLTTEQADLLTQIARHAENANSAAVGEYIKNGSSSTGILFNEDGQPVVTFDLYAEDGSQSAANVYRRVPRPAA